MELMEIERIKANHQREIDTLLENERIIEETRHKNYQKDMLEKKRKARQDQRSTELSLRRDLKKRRDEEHRRSVYLRDQMLQA